jgi:hypothetical protein
VLFLNCTNQSSSLVPIIKASTFLSPINRIICFLNPMMVFFALNATYTTIMNDVTTVYTLPGTEQMEQYFDQNTPLVLKSGKPFSYAKEGQVIF